MGRNLTIEIRAPDGYLNATGIGHKAAKNRRFKDWERQKTTIELMQQILKSRTSITRENEPAASGSLPLLDPHASGSILPVDPCASEGSVSSDSLSDLEAPAVNPFASLIIRDMNQPNGKRAIWIHPDLAIDFVKWVAPAFKLAVSRHIQSYMRGEVTTEDSQAVAQAIAKSSKAGTKQLTLAGQPVTMAKEVPAADESCRLYVWFVMMKQNIGLYTHSINFMPRQP